MSGNELTEIEAACAAEQRKRLAEERLEWIASLDPNDWLFDGRPIRIGMLDAWKDLDWSRARMDMGPSVAGNLGPYWHVPRIKAETTHRLYPKVLRSKWLLTIRQACAEAGKAKP